MAPCLVPMSAVKPVDPACFSRPANRVVSTLVCRRHVPIPQGFCPKVRPMHSTPQRINSSRHLQPLTGPFWRPENLRILGRQALHPRPNDGRRSGQFGTLLGATGGDPNTLAPNRLKARQLRHARQALVRVPESNTKYGGQRGKTGPGHLPVMGASISESSGIPKRKKSSFEGSTRLGPAVHRRCIFCDEPIAFARLSNATKILRPAMPSHPWWPVKRGGMVPPNLLFVRA